MFFVAESFATRVIVVLKVMALVVDIVFDVRVVAAVGDGCLARKSQSEMVVHMGMILKGEEERDEEVVEEGGVKQEEEEKEEEEEKTKKK